MIEDYYGFKAAPFRLTSDARFFFASTHHKKALSYLEYGLAQGEGFIAITGEVGTGKTTLIAHLLAELDDTNLSVAHLATTNLAPEDALMLIARAFKLDVADAAKGVLLEEISAFLEAESKAGRRALLIVDEAQNLPLQTLEELRMLSNVQGAGRFPLQIFLVGQPQFRSLLLQPEMEQLRQRVIASCHLKPLAADELEPYVIHRLEVAGWQGRPALADDLWDELQEASGGVPRRVNLLVSRLLLWGAIEQRDRLDRYALRTVLDDLATEIVQPGQVSADAPAEPLAASAVRPAVNGAAAPAGDHHTATMELAGAVRHLADRVTTLEKSVSELAELMVDLVGPERVNSDNERIDD